MLTEVEASRDTKPALVGRSLAVVSFNSITKTEDHSEWTESVIESEFLDSELSIQDVDVNERRQNNQHNFVSNMIEREVFDSINYENVDKLRDMGCGEQVNMHFKIMLDG